ncbi:Protein of unknown function [Aquimarina amphilecti]|uniref:DUF2867 domain-containing protein n=1 Tax=Aquimarina amphilecti TaxID=1038014 RepID=A0A1H7SHL4_AQUAM|nr:DUF2867 domain-containing protein [Aquimarina amphilecti]SEL71975.1 Protein of unknown function [Aquimarina amphilecti]
MKVEKVNLPETSLLLKNEYDYSDSFISEFIDKEDTIDILVVTKAFFSTSPKWIEKLFLLRNKIVAIFGLKTGDSLEKRKETLNNFRGDIGDKVGIFKVFDKSENEIILGEDDMHLNFRVSLLLDSKPNSSKNLTISTIVNFNNWFGKLYFLPVKPFHKLIVPTMLKSTIRGSIAPNQ